MPLVPGLESRAEVLLAIGARERVQPEPPELASPYGPVVTATAADIFT